MGLWWSSGFMIIVMVITFSVACDCNCSPFMSSSVRLVDWWKLGFWPSWLWELRLQLVIVADRFWVLFLGGWKIGFGILSVNVMLLNRFRATLMKVFFLSWFYSYVGAWLCSTVRPVLSTLHSGQQTLVLLCGTTTPPWLLEPEVLIFMKPFTCGLFIEIQLDLFVGLMF